VFRIALSPSGREEVFIADGGAREMHGVPAGETIVEASADGLVARAEITLTPGQPRTLELRLAPPRAAPDADDP
jgi:hypothetical protein